MNEEEAIERCKQIIKDNNEVIKESRKNRDINSMQLTASLDNDSIAIETLLNLIQEKESNKIENIIEELTITNPANLSEKGLELFNKINEIIDENKEFKNKIDKISQNRYNELRVNGILFCGTDIKQYFED